MSENKYATMPYEDYASACDAIREQTGTNDLIKSGDMASMIYSIEGSGGGVSSTSEETNTSYVKEEALAVANLIDNSSGTFKMAFVSDLHNMDDAPRLEHANQAIQALCRVNDIDCVVFLGDYIRNWVGITKDEAVEDIKECRRKFKNQVVPTIWCRGNHDTNGYVGERLSKEEAYNLIANKNIENGAVVNSADPYGNYGYIDFADKKVRVIYVNTSDNDFMGVKAVSDPANTADLINAHNVSAKQLQWIADTALNFTSGSWKVIFVSHLPLYWSTGSSPAWYNQHTYTGDDGVQWTCNLENMSKLIKAYINKTSFSVTLNGETASKDFSGLSYYATIANGVNGHQHAFWVNTDELVNYISVGNACEGGKTGADGKSYPKIDNTANDTTFDIIDFNFAEQYAFCWNYGAGYDRVVPFRYTAVDVPVSGITLSATSGKLKVGGNVTLVVNFEPATATNRNVSWTSSNNSIATVANGVVTAVAIGNAVITATTEDGGFTATYSLTVEAKPVTNIIETIGYENNARLNSSGVTTTSSAEGYTTTGMINVSAYPDPVTIRTKGVDFNYGGLCYFVIYNASGEKLGYTTIPTQTGKTWNGWSVATDSEGNVTLTSASSTAANYLRLTGYGNGENLIMTINEEIPDDSGSSGGDSGGTEETVYNITKTLTNVLSDNSETTVAEGEIYNTVLTAVDGYSIDSVVVTMGGEDITSNVCTEVEGDYSIVIISVTGDIVIAATATIIESGSSYTNIINTVGYTDGVRLNSSGTTTALEGYTTTGMIDISAYSDPVTIRTKGVNFAYSSSCYCVIYNSSGTKLGYTNITSKLDGSNWSNYTFAADEEGNLVIKTVNSTAADYFRIAGFGSGANLIVTVNEEITD